MMRLCWIVNVRFVQCLKKLENDAVEYAMGPSYMEDDIREKTDKIGILQPSY